MGIELQLFATGDTDYIAKLNSNMETLEAIINAIQTSQGGASGAVTVGSFFTALFQEQTSLIGMSSYYPTVNPVDPTTLDIAAGTAYKGTTQTVVTGIETSITFAGQSPGTYYIVIDAIGMPIRASDPLDAVYNVAWSGTAFGSIVRMAKVLYTVVEEDDARKSTTLNLGFSSLDLRLEAAETTAKEAAEEAQDTADIALAIAGTAATPIRRVCLTIDGGTYPIVTGPKGTIQVDFDGTIEGWSITGDQVGELVVEVSKKASSPPPEVPEIPHLTTDKISASAPIGFTGANAASASDVEVASWTTKEVAEWDVFQFNVISAISVMKATLVIRIREHTPELVVSDLNKSRQLVARKKVEKVRRAARRG
jgi:hypothetical protein